MESHTKSITIQKLFKEATSDNIAALTECYRDYDFKVLKTIKETIAYIFNELPRLKKYDDGKQVLLVWNDLTGKKIALLESPADFMKLRLPNWKK